MGSLFSHCDEDGSLDLIKAGFSSSEELQRGNSYISWVSGGFCNFSGGFQIEFAGFWMGVKENLQFFG